MNVNEMKKLMIFRQVLYEFWANAFRGEIVGRGNYH